MLRLKWITVLLMLNYFIAGSQTIYFVSTLGNDANDGLSWEKALASIQKAVDLSASAERKPSVWVAGGVYQLLSTLQMKEGVNVYGGFEGTETSLNQRVLVDRDTNGIVEPWEFRNETILDGGTTWSADKTTASGGLVPLVQQSVFTIPAVWNGITFRNGFGYNGGGVVLLKNGILDSCTIRNCYASNAGGGLYSEEGTVNSSFIAFNRSASASGGIHASNNNFQANKCKIYKNSSYQTGGGVGNGIYNSCEISYNKLTTIELYPYGGGGYGGVYDNCLIACNDGGGVQRNGNGDVFAILIVSGGGGGISNGTLNNCIVRQNASGQGGGVMFSSCTNTSLIKNYVQSGGSAASHSSLKNCFVNSNYSFTGNTSLQYSGDITNTIISNNNGGVFFGSITKFTNVTIVNNNGGVNNPNSWHSVYLENCLIWGNSGEQVSGYINSVNNCAIQGGYTGVNAGKGIINLSANNIGDVNSPLFVSPSAGIGPDVVGAENADWSLLSGSPCINAGKDSFVVATNLKDIAGTPRRINTVDIGAYEHAAEKSDITISHIKTRGARLTWQNYAAYNSGLILLSKKGGKPPVINSSASYTANTGFGLGTSCNDWYCVSNSIDKTIDITGLEKGTRYYAAVYCNTANGVFTEPDSAGFITEEIVVSNTDRTYGDTFIPVTVSCKSALPLSYSSDNSDIATILNGDILIKGAGTCNIKAYHTGNEVYDATDTSFIFTVRKAQLNAMAVDAFKPYGQPNPALQIKYDGFVNGEDEKAFTMAPLINTTINETTGVGYYPDAITLAGGIANNYFFNYLPGNFTVYKAQATIVISDTLRLYDGIPKSVTVRTTPENLLYNITYNDKPEIPSDPGKYAVKVSINESNYEGVAYANLNISLNTNYNKTTKPEIKVYTHHEVIIAEIPELPETCHVSVYNLSGYKVASIADVAKGILRINGPFVAGTYIVYITSANEWYSYKVVVY